MFKCVDILLDVVISMLLICIIIFWILDKMVFIIFWNWVVVVFILKYKCFDLNKFLCVLIVSNFVDLLLRNNWLKVLVRFIIEKVFGVELFWDNMVNIFCIFGNLYELLLMCLFSVL